MGEASPIQEKTLIRQQLKAKRSELGQREVAARSQAIINRAKELIKTTKPTSIHCFSSITTLNEVMTEDLFGFIWDTLPGCRTFTDLRIDGMWQIGELHRGAFSETASSYQDFDLIFVPTLGFDESRNRLGYGVGFYDRFLAAQPQAMKVGLCFELGKIGQIPSEPHDIPLNMVITEKQAY